MRNFSYKIVNKNDELVGGTIKAFFKSTVRKKLEKDGSTVVYIVPQGKPGGRNNLLFYLSRFSGNDKIMFFSHLHAMMTAGIPIAEALNVVKDQVNNPKSKNIIQSIINDIENGQKLSSAMAKFPKDFSRFLTELVAVGEISGNLTENLSTIAVNLESESELRKKVLSSLAYPIIVITVMIIAFVIMTYYILPHIVTLYKEFGVELPLPTRIVVAISLFVKNYPFFILGGFFLTIITFLLLLKIKRIHYVCDALILRMPVFGTVFKDANLASLFRALEQLFSSGVSLMSSVEITKNTVKNDLYNEALTATVPTIIHGVPISEALKVFPHLFPLQAIRTIEVGEKSGSLDKSFTNLRIFYDRSVFQRTQTITSLIEPILMLLVGITVGTLAVSIFLPIYNVSQIIQ